MKRVTILTAFVLALVVSVSAYASIGSHGSATNDGSVLVTPGPPPNGDTNLLPGPPPNGDTNIAVLPGPPPNGDTNVLPGPPPNGDTNLA